MVLGCVELGGNRQSYPVTQPYESARPLPEHSCQFLREIKEDKEGAEQKRGEITYCTAPCLVLSMALVTAAALCAA